MSDLNAEIMPDEKIISALKELRAIHKDDKKSKHWFALGHALKKFHHANAVKYKDHEFCKSTGCLWYHCSGCKSDGKKCVKTAKEFHKWLKGTGYKIVKGGE